MKGFIDTLKNIWKIEDLRNRILITLAFMAIYRLGTYVVLPGIDPNQMQAFKDAGQGNLLGLLDMFMGGAFFRGSVFALGIMPYISASIAIQLLGMAVPYFQKLQKDGESGRKKITQITRYLTVAVTAFQAIGYITFMRSMVNDALLISPVLFSISTIIVLTAGTVFVMWLGEKITDRGIGNGISILIMVGIIAQLPGSIVQEFSSKFEEAGGLIYLIIELAVLIAVVLATVLLVQGVRRVPVQYAKRIVGNKQYGGVRQYIPLKVNASGVMPIIFAQAIMFIPSFVGGVLPEGSNMRNILTNQNVYDTLWYNLVFFVMVIVFTYFYTAITVNPRQMAEDMKRNGGFIPGVKPGKKTSDFLDTVLSRITLPGSIFLAFVAILPVFARMFGVNSSFANFYGGTSLLIIVGVVLDTLQQIESQLLMRRYDGLMKSGRVKGRAAAGVSSGM